MPRKKKKSDDRTRSAVRFVALAASISSASLCVLLAQSQFDVIIRHGTVVDGTGGAPYAADVAIANGVIVRVGELGSERAAVEIDGGHTPRRTSIRISPGRRGWAR